MPYFIVFISGILSSNVISYCFSAFLLLLSLTSISTIYFSCTLNINYAYHNLQSYSKFLHLQQFCLSQIFSIVSLVFTFSASFRAICSLFSCTFFKLLALFLCISHYLPPLLTELVFFLLFILIYYAAL